MENEKLFAHTITKGNRTYFFDVEVPKTDHLYLSVSESNNTEEALEQAKTLIFEIDFVDIHNFFVEVTGELKKYVDSRTDLKNYNLDDIRKEYPQAYLPWSAADDEKLETLFCAGKTVKELANIFERKEGAIRSRVKKLELKEKYS